MVNNIFKKGFESVENMKQEQQASKGNGIYDFSMSSFYKNGVQWVTRIDDLIVAEA